MVVTSQFLSGSWIVLVHCQVVEERLNIADEVVDVARRYEGVDLPVTVRARIERPPSSADGDGAQRRADGRNVAEVAEPAITSQRVWISGDIVRLQPDTDLPYEYLIVATASGALSD